MQCAANHHLHERATTKHYPKCYAHQRRIHFFSALLPTLMKVRETLTNSITYNRRCGCHLGVSRDLRVSFWSYNMSRLPFAPSTTHLMPPGKVLNSRRRLMAFCRTSCGSLPTLSVALEAYQTLSGINARSGLRLAEREAVQITAAATHGCGFCVAGHTIVAYRARWPV